MTLNPDSEIIPCHNTEDDIPSLKFNFVPINKVEISEKDDIIGT